MNEQDFVISEPGWQMWFVFCLFAMMMIYSWRNLFAIIIKARSSFKALSGSGMTVPLFVKKLTIYALLLWGSLAIGAGVCLGFMAKEACLSFDRIVYSNEFIGLRYYCFHKNVHLNWTSIKEVKVVHKGKRFALLEISTIDGQVYSSSRTDVETILECQDAIEKQIKMLSANHNTAK